MLTGVSTAPVGTERSTDMTRNQEVACNVLQGGAWVSAKRLTVAGLLTKHKYSNVPSCQRHYSPRGRYSFTVKRAILLISTFAGSKGLEHSGGGSC